MASRWINAMLWTLVSVNLMTLVLGGLITWLGYAIPIRLKQFGLSPEITQLAGFASLLVACLGLGGLNYSSHYALNVYGLFCAVFIMLMLFGALPDNLQRAIYSPSRAAPAGGAQQQPPQPQRPPASAAANSSAPAQRLHAAAQHHGLILDLLYIALLVILSVLLALAVTLAQHLRRRQLEEEREEADDTEEPAALDCCERRLVGSVPQRNSGPLGASATARQRLLSAMQLKDMTTDWNCTCNGAGGGGLSAAQAATMSAPSAALANKGAAGAEADPGRAKAGPGVMILAGGGGDAANNNQAPNPIRLRNSKSDIPNRWARWPADGGGARQRPPDQDVDRRQSQLGARRFNSKSLANLARASDDDDDDDEDDGGGCPSGCDDARLADKFLATCASSSLVSKGIFYAGPAPGQTDESADELAARGVLERSHDGHLQRRPARQHRLEPDHSRPYHHHNQQRHNHQHPRQARQHRARTPDGRRCCCSEMAVRGAGNKPLPPPPALAVKFSPTPLEASQASFSDELYKLQPRHNGLAAGRPLYDHNTMPNKLSLSSVYAIRSSSRAPDSLVRKQRQSKLSSGSVMAMTASAAAALLGGVALDPAAISHDLGGAHVGGPLLEDGLDYADPLLDPHAGGRCDLFNAAGTLEECAANSGLASHMHARQHH